MTTPNPYDRPQWASPGYPGMPGVPQAKAGLSTAAKIGIGVAIVLFLGFAGLGVLLLVGFRAAMAGPEVGDCVRITKDDPTRGGYERLTCSSPRAVYKVESRPSGAASCPSGDYAEFELLARGDGSRLSTLCLALNVRSGECLSSPEDRVSLHKTSCGGVDANVEAHVHTGVANPDLCESSDAPVLYSGPPVRTVCLHPVEPKQPI
jgi:hypothetical protein